MSNQAFIFKLLFACTIPLQQSQQNLDNLNFFGPTFASTVQSSTLCVQNVINFGNSVKAGTNGRYPGKLPNSCVP